MSAAQDVVARLVERGIVPRARIVEGDLLVEDASRRNRNLKVVSRSGPSLFVKHATDAGTAATMAREAYVYGLLHADPTGIGAHVPRVRTYDPAEGLLALDLVQDAQGFPEVVHRARGFPVQSAAQMGATLARLHMLPLPHDAPQRLPPMPPGVFGLLRPQAGYLREASGAGVHVMRIIQQHADVVATLTQLAQGWRPEGLVHGDLKWDNWVVSPEGRLVLVDWELASLGEPAWDVGSAINDVLAYWLLSMPAAPHVPPERLPAMAALPLDALLPGLHAFWESYAGTLRLLPEQRAARLERALRFAGARLVQSAFEQMQASPQISATAVLTLQLAQNVLARPRDAALRLLRFPPGSVGA